MARKTFFTSFLSGGTSGRGPFGAGPGTDLSGARGGLEGPRLPGGDAVLRAAAVNERLEGSGVGDTLLGGAGHDTLSGGNGHDRLDGRGGDDRLYGGDGDDLLVGAAGNDLLNGDAGNDRATGGGGNDSLMGGAGHDTLLGGNGNDSLSGGDGRDRLDGGGGHDLLNGAEDDDVLLGGTGNDTIAGGNGGDVLAGMAGSDALLGGEGADAFVFTYNANPAEIAGADSIVGFTRGEDRLVVNDDADLKAIIASSKLVWIDVETENGMQSVPCTRITLADGVTATLVGHYGSIFGIPARPGALSASDFQLHDPDSGAFWDL